MITSYNVFAAHETERSPKVKVKNICKIKKKISQNRLFLKYKYLTSPFGPARIKENIGNCTSKLDYFITSVILRNHSFFYRRSGVQKTHSYRSLPANHSFALKPSIDHVL